MANDKTIYIGLFEMPHDGTDTSARFGLGPANPPHAKWPRNAVITATLDGGEPEVRPVNDAQDGVFEYADLAVGPHEWHASVVGDNIFSGDEDPGFYFTWTITE